MTRVGLRSCINEKEDKTKEFWVISSAPPLNKNSVWRLFVVLIYWRQDRDMLLLYLLLLCCCCVIRLSSSSQVLSPSLVWAPPSACLCSRLRSWQCCPGENCPDSCCSGLTSPCSCWCSWCGHSSPQCHGEEMMMMTLASSSSLETCHWCSGTPWWGGFWNIVIWWSWPQY